MTVFQFSPVTPHPLLSPYIAKMWVFESSGRLPVSDNKLIVPNANFKLAVTYRNGIVANIAGKTFAQSENSISLTGLVDSPVSLDPKEDIQTGTIVIEFNALGAYRLFHLSYSSIKNQIIELPELLGSQIKELQTQLTDAPDVNTKLQLLQNFLFRQLERSTPDPIYDYCVNRINSAKGLITVAQLEKETGYSARWLNAKFAERLGTGPKNLSEIIRFKQFYQAYSTGVGMQSLRQHIYNYYYDQSHFIRAFKRFTGFTPTDLQNSMNELATKHYNG